ncbi:hypothetical protein ACLOJK_004333 [Asimina triloba]
MGFRMLSLVLSLWESLSSLVGWPSSSFYPFAVGSVLGIRLLFLVSYVWCPIALCPRRDLAWPGREVKETRSKVCVARGRSLVKGGRLNPAYEGIVLVSILEGTPLPSSSAPFKRSGSGVYRQGAQLEFVRAALLL